MEKKKKDSKNTYINIVIALLVVAVLAAVLSVLFSKKETKTIEEKEDTVVGALYCVASNPKDPFFAPESAVEGKHEVKITFRSSKADKFAYNYYGVHDSENTADHARSEMHADYNIYMSENGIDQGTLTPVFNYDNTKSIINLFAANGNSLNPVTAKFFFLDNDEFRNLDDYSSEELEKLYVSKGFSCTFDN